MTSLSHPCNSNRTISPVTSWWHHYPIRATAIPRIPQWYDDISVTTIPSIQQFNSVPQWHRSHITIPSIQQQYDLSPSDMMTSLSHPCNSNMTISPVTSWWHHYPIHTTAVQLYPPLTWWHHYPIHTTALQLSPSDITIPLIHDDTTISLSHSYNSNTTLSPSDIMQDDSSPSDITMTSLSHPYNN